jgi:hypothetical protein
VTVRAVIKGSLLSSTMGRAIYGTAQAEWFERTYRARRERYEQIVGADPQATSPTAAIRRCLQAVNRRGYTIRARPPGQIRTFAYVPGNWPHQEHVFRGAAALGPCHRFDYVSRGRTLRDFTAEGRSAATLAQTMREMLSTFETEHKRAPFDWFFSYAVGPDISSDALRELGRRFGIPTVNISLDDKNWWDGITRIDRDGGIRRLAPLYDLAWTSARVAVPWYWAEGGQALFLPEGVDTDWFRPVIGEQDIDVGFVGSMFGRREDFLRTLQRAGLKVVAHGFFASTGALSDDAMLTFFSRCKINLGFGDMHYSRWLTNLKGRDFEIPATGRGLYITSYNSDLASCFHIGREIQCFRGIDELIELARHYLRDETERTAIAQRGRQRCIADHRWSARFATIAGALGILRPEKPSADPSPPATHSENVEPPLRRNTASQ